MATFKLAAVPSPVGFPKPGVQSINQKRLALISVNRFFGFCEFDVFTSGISKSNWIVPSIRIVLEWPVSEDGVLLREAAYTPNRREVVPTERLSRCDSAAKVVRALLKASKTCPRAHSAFSEIAETFPITAS